MRRRIYGYGLAGLSAALLVVGPMAYAAPSLSVLQQQEQQAQQALNRAKNAYRTTNWSMQSTLAKLTGLQRSWQTEHNQAGTAAAKVAAMARSISQVQALISQTQRQMAALQRQIQTTNAQYAAMVKAIAATQARLQAETAMLKGQLRLIEEHGSIGYLDVVMGAHSFSQFISRVTMLGQIAGAAAHVVHVVRQDAKLEVQQKAALAAQQARLQVDHRAAAAHQAALAQERQLLANERSQAQGLEAQATSAANLAAQNIVGQRALMARLRQQEAQLSSQMSALSQQISRIAGQISALLSRYNQGFLSLHALYRALLPLVTPVANKFGLSPALVVAVITEESGGKQSARSVTGAIGLMQLEPGTAQQLGINPYNAEQNVLGGCLYLHQMLGLFHGNLAVALSAYNAGPGAVEANHNQVLSYTTGYVNNIESLYARYQAWGG